MRIIDFDVNICEVVLVTLLMEGVLNEKHYVCTLCPFLKPGDDKFCQIFKVWVLFVRFINEEYVENLSFWPQDCVARIRY